MMLLEWLRRHDPVLDGHMRTYLFTEGPLTEIEAKAEGNGSEGDAGDGGGSGSLGLGGMRGSS